MRITPFTRNQSESEAVGTTGVDTSGAKIAEALGGAGDSVVKSVIDAKVKKKHILDSAEASKKLVDFDLEAEQISQQVQQEYAAKSPEEVRDEVKRRLTARSGELGKGITSPLAKTKFNEESYKAVGRSTLDAYKTANKRQSAQASEAVVGSLNKLANATSATFSNPDSGLEEKMSDLNRKIELAHQVVDASALVYNPEEYQKVKKSVPEMLAKGAILGALQSDPKLARDLLNSGEFDDTLSPEDKTKFLEKADTFEKKKKDLQEIQQKQIHEDTVLSTAKDFLDGNLTLSNIHERVTAGTLLPEVADAFESAVFNPKEWSKLKKDPHNLPSEKGKVLMGIMDSVGSEGLDKVVLRAVDEYNNKRLDSIDLAWVINTANEIKNNPESDFVAWTKQAMGMVGAYSGPAGVPELIRKLSPDQDPRETAREIIQNQQRVRNPKISLTEEIPHSIMDAFGIVKRLWLGEEKMNDYEEQNARPDRNTSNASDGKPASNQE